MHFDFTVHFWTLLSQAIALSGLLRFMYVIGKALLKLAKAAQLVLDEHEQMYRWYLTIRNSKALSQEERLIK